MIRNSKYHHTSCKEPTKIFQCGMERFPVLSASSVKQEGDSDYLVVMQYCEGLWRNVALSGKSQLTERMISVAQRVSASVCSIGGSSNITYVDS